MGKLQEARKQHYELINQSIYVNWWIDWNYYFAILEPLHVLFAAFFVAWAMPSFDRLLANAAVSWSACILITLCAICVFEPVIVWFHSFVLLAHVYTGATTSSKLEVQFLGLWYYYPSTEKN